MDGLTKDLIRQNDELRTVLRLAAITIRRLKRGQRLDTGPLLRKISHVSGDARELAREARAGSANGV